MASIPEPAQPRFSRAGALLVLLVAGVAGVVAAAEYGHFLGVHRSLWVSNDHDRNAHYLFALRLGSALRSGDLLTYLDQVNKARVWPPLQGVLSGAILAVAGPDYRLAVLPPLAGWAACAVLIYLIGCRALERYGSLAGLVGATFLLASPLHRAFATDIMLESVGAALTLGVILAYQIAVQGGTRAGWRGLAVVLTCLFLHKYNYWVIALVSLALAEGLRRPAFYRALVVDGWRAADWGRFLRAESRQPLNYLVVLTLGFCCFALLRGNRPLVLGGRSINIYPPEVPVTVAYLLLFTRLVVWWRAGRGWLGGREESLRQLLGWHVVPVAVFFLLPKHLSAFLWYMGPGNSGPGVKSGLLERVGVYAQYAYGHYHVAGWSAWLGVALFVAGVASWRRLRPGGHLILVVAVVGALLTGTHPNLQGRFLHTWLGAYWLVGGVGVVGLATLLDWLGWRRVGWVAGALAALAVVGLHAPTLARPLRSGDAGPVAWQPSVLDVTDSFARDLAGAERGTVIAAVPLRFVTQWTYLERNGGFDRLEENWYGFAGGLLGEPNRAGFRRWLETTACDTIVLVEDATDPFRYAADGPNTASHAEVRDLLLAQDRFARVKEVAFPRHGWRVVVWKKPEKERVEASGKVEAPARLAGR